jgi:hypothetical protein
MVGESRGIGTSLCGGRLELQRRAQPASALGRLRTGEDLIALDRLSRARIYQELRPTFT